MLQKTSDFPAERATNPYGPPGTPIPIIFLKYRQSNFTDLRCSCVLNKCTHWIVAIGKLVHMATICKLAIPLTYFMYAFELYNMCTHGDSRTIFLFYNVKILSSFSGDKIFIIIEILHDAWSENAKSSNLQYFHLYALIRLFYSFFHFWIT